MSTNPLIAALLKRKSVRAYEERPIAPEVKSEILAATLRAPTAGNQMLYSIIDITDQAIKDRLAVTCDHQSFIATAPMLWLFLADYQRWVDSFLLFGVPEACARKGLTMRQPEEGDLMIACCDALIAAHQAVIAAEALGVGSCYIGDIMEQYEVHQELFTLPKYVFPVSLVCFGYPTRQQTERPPTSRFPDGCVFFENRYRRLEAAGFAVMFAERERNRRGRTDPDAPANVPQSVYFRKFGADFSVEMSRSVRAALREWLS